MATNTTTPKTAATSNVRKQAQWAAIDKKQADLSKKTPGKVGCFIVPVFTEAGKETTNVVRETKSETLCMVMVMSSEPAAYNKLTGFYDQRRNSALILAPKALLATEFAAWKEVGGRIVTRYTVGKGNDRDILYGIGTTIPCVDEDGAVIYRTQKWSPDVTDEDDAQPVIANIEEIRAARTTESLNGKLPARK